MGKSKDSVSFPIKIYPFLCLFFLYSCDATAFSCSSISIPGRDPRNTLPEKLVDKYLSQVSFYFVLDYARIMLEDDNTSRRVFNY